MATIKSFTSIEQSRKLAEILPIESADMYYPWYIEEDGDTIESGHRITTPNVGNFTTHKINKMILPCWSLAALLNVIPYTIYKSDNEFYRLGIDKGYDDYAVWYNNNGFTITDLDVASDNFVDACVEMIIKLHELNLL